MLHETVRMTADQARNRPHLDNLLANVDSIARHTMLLAINEAVKTAQAELAGRDLTIAFEPPAVT